MSHASTRPLPPWPQVKALFDQALEADPPMRAALLTGADVALASEVQTLLAQHAAEEAAPSGFLERPASLGVTAPPNRRGQRLGPWRLTVPLGRGGMGEVWEAQRDDGAFEARVAVKLLLAGRNGAALLQHFSQEQRLLARLNHPHIARLLDAGSTPEGTPFFVMEAVDGRPIDEACRGLNLQARLRLFLQLADAVAHAHAQGLVHRDLKPANVLVTADGQVKLLDFGIAQALDHSGPDAQGARPLTPGYASPEQVRGEAVTTASDVFSLGVLLHLLITGVRPYGRATTTPMQALRAVLEEQLTSPSKVPSDAASDTGVPRRQLRGDLDAIAQKALARAPGARYASVQTLASDLRATLAYRPVAARPRSLTYVTGRFVARHRSTVAASLLALLALALGVAATAWRIGEAAVALALGALAVGLSLSIWQARQAQQARDEAGTRLAETSVLVRDILMRYADMVTYLPGGLRMKTDLLRDTITYLERVRLAVPGDGLLAGELAKALSRLADMELPGLDVTLDDPEAARRHAEQALALFPLGEPAHHADPAYPLWWARAMRVQQRMLRTEGDAQAALNESQRMRRFLQLALRRFPDDFLLRFEFGSVLVGIAQALDTWVEPSLENAQGALQALTEAEAAYSALRDECPDDRPVRYQLGTIAGARMIVLSKLKRWDEAVDAGRQGIACREAALSLQPQNTAFREGTAGERNNFTRVLLDAGRVEEALEVSARGETLIEALVAEDPDVATWVARRRTFAMHRGRALLHAGQAEQALPRLRDAMLGMAATHTGAALLRRGWCGFELARALYVAGQEAAARTTLAEAQADLHLRLIEVPQDAEVAALATQAAAQQQAWATADTP